MTAPNAELAYRVLDHIDAHPETWDQSSWVCGTTACFAGWAVRLSGAEIEQSDPDEIDSAVVVGGPAELIGAEVRDAAVNLLGSYCVAPRNLDDHRPGNLFSDSNTREDLGELVAEIFGPRPDVTA